jgi:hypothetical protein
LARTKNEQKRRFALIPFVKQILKNPKAVIEYRSNEIQYFTDRHGNKVLTTSVAQFWTFVEKIDGCEIKVVIRQINKNEPHFFSVMGDKVKIHGAHKTHKKSP